MIMLKELHIKNVAVIDEVNIEFLPGFNVLTGETGAGKSILIDSINMALGNRTGHNIIRTGCDFASVSICFETDKKTVLDNLSELGIDADDGIISLSRRLSADGKSTCRINGVMAPAGVLREVAANLIDIHAQNDNHSLLNKKQHLALLDDFGNLSKSLNDYRTVYDNYRNIENEISELSQDEEQKARRLDLLRFQIEEIRAANLKIGEDENLEHSRDRLYNMESIISGAGTAYTSLYGAEDGTVCDLLRKAARALSDTAEYDNTLSQCFDRLSGVIAEAEDIASEINDVLSKSDFNMAELDKIEERLDLVTNLKRKYGNTIEEILDFADKAEAEAGKIEKSDQRLLELNKLRAEVFTKLSAVADKLSGLRHKTAKALEALIANELVELDMPKVKFSICLSQKLENSNVRYTETGYDDAEFLISTNPGEELKPMSKIASGGELSRIMLAIKSVLSSADIADTMIFDEIDTGVSGRAAQKIAEKMFGLSRNKQVLAITHLAQIASMADSHFLIKKSQADGRTSTSVNLLSGDLRIAALAGIIGGVTVTDLTLENAKEMLKMADEKKRKYL